MTDLRFSLSLLVVSILCISGMVEPSSVRRSRSRGYIEDSCQGTSYPTLCVQYLSCFPNSTIQSPQQLAQAALSASLYRAQHTRLYMLKVAKELKVMRAKDYQAVKDCLDQINDSVEQLSESIRELRRLGGRKEAAGRGGDVFWHLSNVESWTSAALSDASYCVDELSGRRMSKLRATIKGKVLNVAQATSNALALFHRYAAKYRRAGATSTKP